MENICLRFPQIAVKVLKNVDNQTLINFKLAGRMSPNFINGEKFYWYQILKRYWQIEDSQAHGWQMVGSFSEYWRKIMKQTPLAVVKKVAMASIQKSRKFRYNKIRDWSPFHLAAAFGNLELYKWIEEKCRELPLIECSSNIVHMYTPIHLSADHGNLEVIKYLLKKSVNKNPGNNGGVTPLHLAARNGQFDMCIMLIANISGEKNPRDSNGRTPLHEAAYQGYLDICKLLIYNTTNKNPRDDSGTTPLDLAYPVGHSYICKLIIENVDNFDPNLRHISMERVSLLSSAAINGNLVVYQSIVENVTEKNPSDNNGTTPFHRAARFGHLDLCKVIIGYLQNKNPGDVYGVTPLHEAARWGYLKICGIIIEYTQNSNVVDNNGQIPRALAEQNGHFEVSKFLKLFEN